MKILILADGMGPKAARGIEVIFENIKILNSLGAQITLLTTKDYFTQRESWEEWKGDMKKRLGIKIHAIEMGQSKHFIHLSIWISKILTFYKAVTLLRGEKFDVIHEYSSSPVIFLRTALLGKILNSKTVHTIITYNSTLWGKPFWGVFSKLLDKVIFTSEIFSTRYQRFISKDKYEIIPLGVDTNKFNITGCYRKIFNLPEKEKIILYIGPPEKSKGVELLLDTLEKIIKKNNQVFFLFAFFRKVTQGNQLEELEKIKPPALVSMAVKIGKTRLIDNIVLE